MTFLHKYLTHSGHPDFPLSRRSGTQIFDNWLMRKEMQQPSDRPVRTDGLNALIQGDDRRGGDRSGTVKRPGGSELPLRWPVGRSQLVAGVLVAIGASILTACSSNAASTTGHAIPADINGGNAAGAGSVLGASSPAFIQYAIANGVQPTAGKATTTATAKHSTPTTTAQKGTTGVGTDSTGSGGQISSPSLLDPSGEKPTSTLSGFTLKYLQEFGGNSLPANWDAYSGGDSGPQADDNEAHFDPSLCTFSDGEAHFIASGVDSCGMHYAGGPQEYGAWFARLKGESLSSNVIFSDIFLLWPDNNQWPPEIDIYEDNGNRSKTTASMYNTVDNVCGASPTPQCLAPYEQSNGSSGGVANDDTQWHTYGVEWTPSGVTWFIDGNVVFSAPASQVKSPARQAAAPMDMDLQVQNQGGGTPTQVETMTVDWVEEYSYNG